MQNTKGTILTNQGNLMIIESINSKQPLVFTRVSVGSGVLLDSENPKELINLKQNVKSINIPYYSQTKPGQLKIVSSFTNETFTDNVIYRETGVWAKVGLNGAEKLYAYENKGVNGEPIPAFNGQNRMERGFAFYFSIKSASNIQVNIDSSMFITIQHLIDQKNLLTSEISKKSDLTYVNKELSKKSDKSYTDTELSKKADKTYTNTELAKRAQNVDNNLKTIAKDRTGATNENYDVIRAINGASTGEYIQDITECQGGKCYIDRITGKQFTPANLEVWQTRIAPININGSHGWSAANSDWKEINIKNNHDILERLAIKNIDCSKINNPDVYLTSFDTGDVLHLSTFNTEWTVKNGYPSVSGSNAVLYIHFRIGDYMKIEIHGYQTEKTAKRLMLAGVWQPWVIN